MQKKTHKKKNLYARYIYGEPRYTRKFKSMCAAPTARIQFTSLIVNMLIQILAWIKLNSGWSLQFYPAYYFKNLIIINTSDLSHMVLVGWLSQPTKSSAKRLANG